MQGVARDVAWPQGSVMHSLAYPAALLLLGAIGGFGVFAAEPAPPTDWLMEARVAQAKGLVLKAVELAGKAVEATPKDPRVWYFRAGLLERAQQLSAAESDLTRVLELTPDDPAVLMHRGVLRMRIAKFSESVADLDRYAALRPGRGPYLWQRGIALFYAKRFDDGRKQFESHRTVNPNDVENAAWHFACVAQMEGFASARQKLIPVEGDPRVPMREIQDLYAGKVDVDSVIAAAERVPTDAGKEEARFYAHLYLGLYEEARGKLDAAAKHLAEAAKRADALGLMGDVGRLHAAWLADKLRERR